MRLFGWLLVILQFAAMGWMAVLLVWSFPWGPPVWILLGISSLLFASAVPALGDSLTPDPLPNLAGLKTRGIYRLIRHPMYAALALVGVACAVAAPTGWIPMLLADVALLGKITLEERHLSRAYPGYAEYAARTKRLIPYVW